MKVDIGCDDSLLVVPETDFETQVLKQMFPVDNNYRAFIKTGTMQKEIVGLKITRDLFGSEKNTKNTDNCK